MKKLISIKAEQKEEQEKLIENLIELEFPQWRKSLSKEQVNTIAPSNYGNSFTIDVLLQSHFKNEILIPRLISEGKIKRYDEELSMLRNEQKKYIEDK